MFSRTLRLKTRAEYAAEVGSSENARFDGDSEKLTNSIVVRRMISERQYLSQ